MIDHIGMLRQLLDYDAESGNRSLTDPEVKFLDNICGAMLEPATLTWRQEERLEEIWNAVFGDN